MTTKATTARYISRYRELKIVRKASYTKEVDGRVVSLPGESIRFADGLYQTSDPAVIEFLEARPEFGDIFVRVPDNVDAMVHRSKHMKDLESKEQELAEREAAVAAREAKLNASEEGSGAGQETDGLDELKKAELLEIATKEEVENVDDFRKPGVKNADIVSAIRAKREAGKAAGDAPAY